MGYRLTIHYQLSLRLNQTCCTAHSPAIDYKQAARLVCKRQTRHVSSVYYVSCSLMLKVLGMLGMLDMLIILTNSNSYCSY
jgi:hypothetical protein